MSTLRLPIIPNPNGEENRCRQCKHWLLGQMQTAVPINGQWVPLAGLIEEGNFNSSTMPVEPVAPCTITPMWQTMKGDHWCSQFKKGDE